MVVKKELVYIYARGLAAAQQEKVDLKKEKCGF